MEFEAWPKTPRLNNGGVTITEKIDGTNACVIFNPVSEIEAEISDFIIIYDGSVNQHYEVGVQSRKRFITPESDNAGFARYVHNNAYALLDLLGPGHHFGEWWGQGIQRRYGMDRKVFSLFNTHRWGKIATERPDWFEKARDINLSIVPLLYLGVFSDFAINHSLDVLRQGGSFAAAEWGFSGLSAEGIIIRHRELGGNLKVLLENDNIPKGLQVQG